MFSLFDPTGRGHISHEQYDNGERSKPHNGQSDVTFSRVRRRSWFEAVVLIKVARYW